MVRDSLKVQARWYNSLGLRLFFPNGEGKKRTAQRFSFVSVYWVVFRPASQGRNHNDRRKGLIGERVMDKTNDDE